MESANTMSLMVDPTQDDAGERAAELEAALAKISHVRHELNNHLMTAMAEVQYLLLDESSDEVRESHGVILAQLRAMRDIVAGTADLTSRRIS